MNVFSVNLNKDLKNQIRNLYSKKIKKHFPNNQFLFTDVTLALEIQIQMFYYQVNS